ncbi:winged helix-turn-helix transcriptional regulator [Myxococcus sp. CA051A]|uniref:MarR family winged helix-turn-helix transcriptional regulator n=1 Tax=unclassified Myxococcus TaxID=2648731 RepID=UPI00157AD5B4|nr:MULTISPECIES: MarR family winged helix-turn-helix transcriptional regulator [unclassified Myxococcus]NTX10783.1 winged helix-turn-helix transcriptional regulator [Myxococcus sp. CA056]NTX66121.1 winged helix-turn-helix transcriptional regulator [Myxococcus sp. CA051A]
MAADRLYVLLERLGNLLRTEERAAGLPHGLQPVHLQALRYLQSCNRYSNTPAALTEYLGLTKGTVSQTLLLLEEKGLLRKQADTEDRRVIHLLLTEAGRAVLKQALPPELFKRALAGLPGDGAALDESLTELLRALQAANAQRSFGACGTCKHFQREGAGRFRCGLTQDPLSREDSQLLCREHEGISPGH